MNAPIPMPARAVTAARRLGLAALFAAQALLAAPAQAGRSCEARPPSVTSVARGLALAERVQQALQAEHTARGTRVVALARAGQDLSRHGIRWSHMAWAYRQDDGRWRVVHKLNHCGTASADVYRQGLAEFFLDDPWRHEAAWAPLAPPAQEPLWALLQDNRRVATLHEPRYSLVSHAWAQRYQQSNQWAIETLALGMEPGIRSRDAAQAWLRVKGYQPAVLRIGPLTRLGGRIAQANVAFDDHPDADRFRDRIATVTADSVLDWLVAAGFAGAPRLVTLP